MPFFLLFWLNTLETFIWSMIESWSAMASALRRCEGIDMFESGDWSRDYRGALEEALLLPSEFLACLGRLNLDFGVF